MRKDCRKAKFYVGYVSDRDYVGWPAVQVRRKGSGAALAYVSGRHETQGEIFVNFSFSRQCQSSKSTPADRVCTKHAQQVAQVQNALYELDKQVQNALYERAVKDVSSLTYRLWC